MFLMIEMKMTSLMQIATKLEAKQENVIIDVSEQI
jgi:hypothetical protein